MTCLCGHPIEDHPTERLYWTGDGDSPCRHCRCEDYDGEGYPAHNDGRVPPDSDQTGALNGSEVSP